MSTKIQIGQLSAEVEKILNDYSEKVSVKTEEAAEKVGKQAAKELKSASPVGKGKDAGEYAKGWKATVQGGNLNTSVVVHNTKVPGIAHLLEHGHAKVAGGRTVGTVAPIVHIKPVEERAIEQFENMIREAIK